MTTEAKRPRCGIPTDSGPCCRLPGHVTPTHWGRLAIGGEVGCGLCGVLEVEPGDHAVGCPKHAATPAPAPAGVYYVERAELLGHPASSLIRALERVGPFGSDRIAAERHARKLSRRTGQVYEAVSHVFEKGGLDDGLVPSGAAPGGPGPGEGKSKRGYTASRTASGTVHIRDATTGEKVLEIEKGRYEALVQAVDAEGRRPELDAAIEAAVREHESKTKTPRSSRGVILALSGLAALAHEPSPRRR